MSNNKILWGSDKNALIALLSINLVMFVFFRMMYIIFQNDPETHLPDYNGLIQQFALPSNFSSFLQKPWTLLTYFFSNDKFFVLASNMIWLFSFAYLLQQVVGNEYIIPAYIYGGLVSGIVFIITNLIFKNNTGSMMGATPAILAVAATLVGFVPQYKLFPMINNGIPIWILFVLFLIIDGITTFYQNKFALPAHIAAAGIGFFYAKSVQRGNDFGKWMHNLYDEILGKSKPKNSLTKSRQFYQQNVVPFNKQTKVNQTTIDEVLDKINTKGINSLTKEEQLILQKAKDQL